jgi:hypothetical protein
MANPDGVFRTKPLKEKFFLWKKITSTKKNTFGFLAILIVVAALPLTVLMSQQQTSTQQHASTVTSSSACTNVNGVCLSSCLSGQVKIGACSDSTYSTCCVTKTTSATDCTNQHGLCLTSCLSGQTEIGTCGNSSTYNTCCMSAPETCPTVGTCTSSLSISCSSNTKLLTSATCSSGGNCCVPSNYCETSSDCAPQNICVGNKCQSTAKCYAQKGSCQVTDNTYTSSNTFGTTGMYYFNCSKNGGHWVSNLCPGPSQIKCCVSGAAPTSISTGTTGTGSSSSGSGSGSNGSESESGSGSSSGTSSSTTNPTSTPVSASESDETDNNQPTETPEPTVTPPPYFTLFFSIGLDGIGAAGDHSYRCTDLESCNDNKDNIVNGTRNTDLTKLKVMISNSTNQNNPDTRYLSLDYNGDTGFFETSDTINLPNGNYTIKVGTPGFMADYILPIQQKFEDGQEYILNTLNLTNGDINQDQKLSVTDYQILMSCLSPENGNIHSFDSYQICNQSPSYAKLADLNNDGVVDNYDFILFEREYGVQSGR